MATATIKRSLPTGSEFKAARQAAGLTQYEAAVAVGCDRSTIQHIEAGRTVRSISVAAGVVRVYRKLLKAAV